MPSKRAADKQREQQEDASRASTPIDSRVEASSSQRTSTLPNDPSKPQIDFHFLNFSHPSEAKTGKTRKAVRSHVTKQQHQRESAAAAAVKKVRSRQPSPESDDMERRPLAQRSRSTPYRPRRPPLEAQLPSSSQSESPEPSPVSVSPTASPIQTPGLRIDPMEIYPEEWHPYIPRIMDHYTAHLLIDIPDIGGAETAGLLRTRLLPFVLTDPAPLHATMLCAASHYGKARGSRSHTIDVLRLRGMAIREINNALEDTYRALSDQLILAVAKMATYEALYGEKSTFNTHMTGLLRMVSLRGGLPALGLDGFLERVLLWIDSNASHIVGSHLYFDKVAFPTTATHPMPDPTRFSGGLA